MVTSLRVLFLGKRGDQRCVQARAWCEQNFCEVAYFDGDWGEPLPEAARQWRGDLVISYLCRWVVPVAVLERAGLAAINFHPAPPEYPGIGCNNFALYENAPTYGATCHHMAARVDTGSIIQVKRFDMAPDQTVASLLERTYAAMAELFGDVMSAFVRSGNFPQSGENWTRPPFTRAQFEALRRIEPGMPADEVARRVRATDYPPWGPYVELHGHKFQLVSKA
ncbi:MAG: formyltransferase family protein [Ramlibacter sp.]